MKKFCPNCQKERRTIAYLDVDSFNVTVMEDCSYCYGIIDSVKIFNPGNRAAYALAKEAIALHQKGKKPVLKLGVKR